MVNVSVDLAPAQLKFLQVLLNAGEYRSRSEAVRDFIRRAEFEREWRGGIEEVKRKGVKLEEFEAEGAKVRGKLYKERFSRA